MKFSPERIKALQLLLKKQCGRDYTIEETQQAGMAIIQFVQAKGWSTEVNNKNEDVANETQAKKRTTK